MIRKQYNPMELKEALKRGGQSDLRFACDFADRIVAAVKKAGDTELFSEDILVYRARNDYECFEAYDESGSCEVRFCPLTKEKMGAPPESKTSLGRFNSPNEPVLYLATTREVALAEIRALHSDICTVATFHFVTPVKIAKLLRHNETSIIDIIDQKESNDVLEKWLLTQTADFVSRRLQDHDRELHCRACNLIASAFRDSGINGLAYRTSFWSPAWREKDQSVDENHVFASNIVLFDPQSATPGHTEMFQINWKRPLAERY